MSPASRPDAALTALTRQAEALWQSVSPWLPTFSVEILPSIDSTNTELMRRAREGQTTPTLLVTLEQTAGRGRRGKHWVSRPGASLTFSLGLPLHPQDWSGLSLAVGVSLADNLHPEVRLKWPNDLWLRGQKLGGILVETASMGLQRYAVVGVGLNVETPNLPAAASSTGDPTPLPAVPPIGLQNLPTDTAQWDAGQWLAQVAPALVKDLLLFERQGFAAFAERFDRRDALKGLALRLSDGQEGVGLGVAADGTLRLQTPQGVVPITSAEVSVRPC